MYANGAEFQVSSTTCTGVSLVPGGTCTINLRFYVTDCSGDATATLRAGDGVIYADASANGSFFQSCVECTGGDNGICDASYTMPFTMDWIVTQRRT
jgi:hypothetical protein